jgi:hypothetical protein
MALEKRDGLPNLGWKFVSLSVSYIHDKSMSRCGCRCHDLGTRQTLSFNSQHAAGQADS